MKKMIRQGDVQIIPIDSIPSEAKKLIRKELAYGEVTGHAHRLDVGELFETKNGELYLDVKKLTKVSHEEHKTAVIPKGKYRVVIKRQYNAESGWEKVAD